MKLHDFLTRSTIYKSHTKRHEKLMKIDSGKIVSNKFVTNSFLLFGFLNLLRFVK